jgi:hypothetical protein
MQILHAGPVVSDESTSSGRFKSRRPISRGSEASIVRIVGRLIQLFDLLDGFDLEDLSACNFGGVGACHPVMEALIFDW